MRFPKSKSRVVAAAAVAVLLAVGGWQAFKPSGKPAQNTGEQKPGQSGQVQTSPSSSSQPAVNSSLPYIETAGFKYQEPSGWAQMSQKVLDSSGAASGIARPTAPAATFTLKVSEATPKDDNDLKNSILDELKKFSHFELKSASETKVDGEGGQKFVYNFSDKNGDNKVTQQMSVIVNKNKTYFLLFSSAAADLDKQTGDFAQILASFHFK